MNNDKYPGRTYPYRAPQKEQFVLITENGNERTSNVTDERIFQSVYEVDSHTLVGLEKCVPVNIGPSACVFAMSYNDDSVFAVHVDIKGTILRMLHFECSPEEAVDRMCDFFHLSQVPDIHGWECEELLPVPKKSESHLTVDGEDFRFFDFTDVMAALENIRDGKSKWLHHDHTGEDGGYMEIRRCTEGENIAYKVEWVKWTQPVETGCRAVITDFKSLYNWLWDFALNRKYPGLSPVWTQFDVKDYFQKLVFKFLDNHER
ncbi:hypothetical protein [uncultured Bacteroides sp.]|nr:hypothetical protein [uncultured Bacteroides sp.]